MKPILERLAYIFKHRIIIIAVAFAVLFSILVVHLFRIQIIHGSEYKADLSTSMERDMSTPAARGRIFDRNGNLLAYDELTYAVNISDSGLYSDKNEKNATINDTVLKTLSILKEYNVSYSNDFNLGYEKGRGYYYKVEGDNAKFLDYIGSVTASIGKAEQFIQAEDVSVYYKDKDKINYINGSYYTLGSRGEYVFPEMTFTSSNPDIVEVDQYGALTVKSIGTATITISASETDVYRAASKAITVTVSKVGQEDYITMPSANRFIYDGNEKTLITPVKNYIGDVYYRVKSYGSWLGNWSKDVPVATEPGDYDIYWYLDGGESYASIGSQEDPAGFVTSKIDYWGETKTYNGIQHYVEYNGKTSVEVSGNNIIWLKEESDGTYAWYGLDNSSGFFQKGSRFSVRWIDSDTDPDEWARYYNNIDDKHKVMAENGKLWIFLVEVVAPDGTKYENFGGNSIPFYIELGSDWDKEDVNAIYVVGGSTDESVAVYYVDNFEFPGGTGTFAKLMLKHFSPYAVYDSYGSYYSPSSTNYSYSTSNYSTPTSYTKSSSTANKSAAVKTSDNYGTSLSFAMFCCSACVAFALCKKKYID